MTESDPRSSLEMNPIEPSDSEMDAEDVSDVRRSTSPVRPANPEPPKPRIALSPAKPVLPRASAEVGARAPETTAPEGAPADKANQALEALRNKMTAVVQEYADGKINQAQFNAIYKRYSEQREITERLLERNPQSGAWQSVIRPGHTGFLRDHFAAKILSYGLYRLEDGNQIILQGRLRLPAHQLKPILSTLKAMIQQGQSPKPARRKLKDGTWVLLAPGKHTASVVIFSLEPATMQRQHVEDAQRDFERANDKLIRSNNFDPSHLVFPHRALFE